MAVEIEPRILFTARELIVPDAGESETVVHDGFNTSGTTYHAESAAPVTVASYETWTIDGAGAAAIDLTALPILDGVGVKDCTGLKVQTIEIKTRSENAGDVTIKPAAVNGYNLFGSASGEITLPPGGTFGLIVPEFLPDVAAVAKDIAITGTEDDTVNIGLCLG